MSFNGDNITGEDVSAHSEGRYSRNEDDKNENCKRKASDDNKIAEGNFSEQTENTSK